MSGDITRRRFIQATGAAALGTSSILTRGAGFGLAAQPPAASTVVFPTGVDVSHEYALRGPNAPLDWFFPPDVIDVVGAAVPVYFGNIFSPDALEVMAAIHGGRAEDYWRPVRWDFDAAVHAWLPTFLTDPYPGSYPQSGRSYPGGGHILLKATDEAGTPTAFNLGTTPGMLSWSLEIGGNCVLEGEILDDTYDAPETLAGKPRMTELVNGLAGIGVNFYRIDTGSYIGAATEVEFRNLVLRGAGVWPIAIYGSPWMSDKIDVLAENVHVVDLWSPTGILGSVGGGFLGHNNAGDFHLRDCSTHVRNGGIADFAVGALYAANPWDTTVDVEITGCDFALPSLPFGSAGIVLAGGQGNFHGEALCRDNSVDADIAFEVVGDWVGTVNIAHNPGPRGAVTGRKIGCLVGTPKDGANVTIEHNHIHVDSATSAATALPVSAGVLGWEFSYTSMILAGFDAVPVPSHAVVRNNTFTGTADVGVAVGGVNAVNVAAENVFVANNLSGLDATMGLTYAFSEETADNVVIGNTAGTSNVVEGNESNAFTGSGFQGLGAEAAERLTSAMATGSREALTPQNAAHDGWFVYHGPRA